MNTRFLLRSLLLLLVAATLAACASTPRVTGTARAPIDPAMVRVYYSAPTVPYEEVARLDVASGSFTFGSQARTNDVIDRLRRQAAQLGANGVVLLGTADAGGGTGVSIGGSGGSFGGRGYSGVGVGVTVSPSQRQASGIAIFVPAAQP